MFKCRVRTSLVVLCVSALVAAGCDPDGGDGGDGPDPSGSEQTAPNGDTETDSNGTIPSGDDSADPNGSDDDSDEDTAADESSDNEPAGDESSDVEPNDDAAAQEEDADGRVVQLYVLSEERGDIDDIFPVERTVPTPDVLHGALEELLAGPTAEEEAEGYWSFFSEETDEMLNSVTIDDGVARVDFDANLRDALPNAGTSTGAITLLAQLDGTAEQFSSVDEAIYSLGGDVNAFYGWLQMVPPER